MLLIFKPRTSESKIHFLGIVAGIILIWSDFGYCDSDVKTQWSVKLVSPKVEANFRSPRWALNGKRLGIEAHFVNPSYIGSYIVEDISKSHMKQNQLKIKQNHRGAIRGYRQQRSTENCTDLALRRDLIAFVCSDLSFGRQLILRHMSGLQTILMKGEIVGHPAWSPVDLNVAFVSAVGKIYIAELGERGEQSPKLLIAHSSAMPLYPRWSSDGKNILYTLAKTDGISKIFLVQDVLTKPNEIELSESVGNNFLATWSPKGTRVAFYREDDVRQAFGTPQRSLGSIKGIDDTAIWMLGLNRLEHAFKLVSRATVDSYGPAWTPDGRWIIYSHLDQRGEQLFAVEARRDGRRVQIPLPTVANRSPSIVQSNRGWMLAYTSLGKKGAPHHLWRKVYITRFSKKMLQQLKTI